MKQATAGWRFCAGSGAMATTAMDPIDFDQGGIEWLQPDEWH